MNTIFGVVHAVNGYTAWIDKHASYSMVAGPGGTSLDDFYAPEVDSNVIALPASKPRRALTAPPSATRSPI